jgi:hypothetical protein
MSTTLAGSIEGIAGRRGDKNRARYANNESGLSDASLAIEELAFKANLERLTGAQSDHLGRILSGIQSYLWIMTMEKKGLKTRPWNPKKGRPRAEKLPFGYETKQEDWMDHLSVSRDGKEETFVSEPYQLSGEALRQLVRLLDEGWDVFVSACFSTHFPGRTVRVLVRRSKETT